MERGNVCMTICSLYTKHINTVPNVTYNQQALTSVNDDDVSEATVVHCIRNGRNNETTRVVEETTTRSYESLGSNSDMLTYEIKVNYGQPAPLEYSRVT
ncbi:hypothetical protein J6590_072451 [Homalodisca vitripennis]|nr:hypothetical protein J6590_072451 [Homalodisca vitripennis]